MIDLPSDFSSVIDRMLAPSSGPAEPLPADWAQGRTAFGGFSSALMLGAAMRDFSDLPPLRSVLVNFTGPISERPDVSTECLRQGRNITTIHTRATNGEKNSAFGVFTFGVERESHLSQDHPAPDANHPDDYKVDVFEPGKRPGFHQHFDIRDIEGDAYMSGSDRGYIRKWIRFRDPTARNRPEAALCLADCLPPSAFPMMKQFGPNSSVNWICNFFHENLKSEGGWYQVESTLTATMHGYSSQVMRMWNTSGDMVVDGMQSVLIFA
ncbi:MAG: thioesterase family protein [Pseudomonadota bacterium]